jgi:hypothetical protein
MEHTNNKTSSVQNQNRVHGKNNIIITADNLPILLVFLNFMMMFSSSPKLSLNGKLLYQDKIHGQTYHKSLHICGRSAINSLHSK